MGYSVQELKHHLEAQFTPEMSWENYSKFWQIDHIIPLSWFKTVEQSISRGWVLNNLQPLERKLNNEKKNYYVGNPKTNNSVIYLPAKLD